IEEERKKLLQIKNAEMERGRIIARNTDIYGKLTAHGQDQLDVFNKTVGNLGDQEQIQLSITNLTKERQTLAEELVKLGDALADSDTKQAKEQGEKNKRKERELELEKLIAKARESVEMAAPQMELLDPDTIFPE